METNKPPHSLFKQGRSKKRCSGNKKTNTQTCSGILSAPAFLNYAFQPVVDNPLLLESWKAKEKTFFQSLANLAKSYTFIPEDVSQIPYPLNIYFAYTHAVSCIKNSNPDVQLVIADINKNKCCLTVVEQLNIDNTLFYLPLRPLHRMVQREETKDLSIVLPIFCYLRTVVNFPSYLNNGATGWYYSQIIQSAEYEDEAYGEHVVQEIKDGLENGKKLMRIINKKSHLHDWAKCLDQYKDKSNKLWVLSTAYYKLYQTFPHYRIDQNLRPGFIDPEADDRASLDQYASFVWEDDGTNVDELEEYMDSRIMECGTIEVPLKITCFDKANPEPSCDLIFENTLLDLLGDFASILYKLP